MVHLTERERQVLQLAADGYSVARAAQRLGISSNTVKAHLKHINRALGAKNRSHAVAIAMRMGVIE